MTLGRVSGQYEVNEGRYLIAGLLPRIINILMSNLDPILLLLSEHLRALLFSFEHFDMRIDVLHHLTSLLEALRDFISPNLDHKGEELEVNQMASSLIQIFQLIKV